MSDDPLLMIPGPVPVADPVREAMGGQTVSHRSPAFEAIYRECRTLLRPALGTDGDLVFCNATGSAAMETAVANVADTGRLVCLANGKFGDTFEWIGSRYTDDLTHLRADWGQSLPWEAYLDAMDDDVAAVTVVHAETTSGIVNPIDDVAAVAHDHDALVIADCVTSVASEPIRVDDWGVDMAVVAPQKALGAPPGLSALTVSERAQDRIEPADAPRYFDLARHLAKAATDQTPTTSPVQLFMGLRAALRLLEAEGYEARIARFERFSRAVRAAVAAVGLDLFPTLDTRTRYANAVTVMDRPEAIAPSDVVGEMADRGVVIREGLNHLVDETIRIGTMGPIDAADVRRTLSTFHEALVACGYEPAADPMPAVDEALAG